jgi:hypothetical protein
VDRLTRLMQLGDRALQRLIQLRPAVAFLETLRNDLQAESARVAQSAFETAERGQA